MRCFSAASAVLTQTKEHLSRGLCGLPARSRPWSGSEGRRAPASPEPVVHGGRGAVAGARHRREHGHFRSSTVSCPSLAGGRSRRPGRVGLGARAHHVDESAVGADSRPPATVRRCRGLVGDHPGELRTGGAWRTPAPELYSSMARSSMCSAFGRPGTVADAADDVRTGSGETVVAVIAMPSGRAASGGRERDWPGDSADTLSRDDRRCDRARLLRTRGRTILRSHPAARFASAAAARRAGILVDLPAGPARGRAVGRRCVTRAARHSS